MRNRYCKYSLALMMAFLVSFPLTGQDSLTNEALEIDQDSSILLLNKWRNSRDFSYMNYLDSMLKVQKIKVDTVRIDKKTGKVIRRERAEKAQSFLSKIFKSSGTGLFLRILAVFFILFILSKVFLQSGFFSFNGKRKKKELQGSAAEPFKALEAYVQLILEAEQNNEFNTATRYWFLKTLKILADRELIQFSMDKTNEDFIRELKDFPFQKEFREITRIYEYVWYGEVFLKKEMYDKIKFSFEKFAQKISTES